MKQLFNVTLTLRSTLIALIIASSSITATYAAESEEDMQKYTVKLSGFMRMTASEDFGGTIDNYDFIPSLIDVPTPSHATPRFRMDFSTSRINVDASTVTKDLGKVELHIDMDFRGGTQGSYTPRLRTGHVAFMNFMVGKTFSNFTYLDGMTPQIDFQGPINYSLNYSPQVRYSRTLLDGHIKTAVSLEYLTLSLSSEIAGTSAFEREKQTLPIVPAFVQYNWGNNLNNQIRFSAIYRPLSAYNTATDESVYLTGWGTQLGGRFNIIPAVQAYYKVTYGCGITEYLSDLYGSGLEYTVNPDAKDGIEATPMYSWGCGLKIDFSKSVFMDLVYSESEVGESRKYYTGDSYHDGTFLSGNLYYMATKQLTLATEYIWGERENMNFERGKASRLYLMVQYDF